MADAQKIAINLGDYVKQKGELNPRVKVVSLDGLAYLQIRQYDSGTGKQLTPQLIPVSSEGVQSVIDGIMADLALHQALLTDVQAAEAQKGEAAT